MRSFQPITMMSRGKMVHVPQWARVIKASNIRTE